MYACIYISTYIVAGLFRIKCTELIIVVYHDAVHASVIVT